jgi:hypothetical protein
MFDDEPDTEWVIQYTPPVPREDLNPVQDILRGIQPFVPGVFFEDPYEVMSYVSRQLLWREEYYVLVDRNLVTRWIGFVRGTRVCDNHRAAAAVMLFAQAADLFIEPSIAFYEVADIADTNEVNQEIDAFYTAEEATPQAWADIALGRTEILLIPAPEMRRPRKFFDLSRPLYHWRRNYVLALKIASLHLERGNPEQMMTRLLDWMYRDFLIGGPAVQLASYYFAPGAPRKKLLKSIESNDRERAIQGVKNAAWDLTLISEWLRRVKESADPEQKRLWLLATLDASVRNMARDVISFDDADNDLDHLEKAFAKVWNQQASSRLAKLLHRYQSDPDNPARYLHRDPNADAIDDFIAAGEGVIREWKPRRGSV